MRDLPMMDGMDGRCMACGEPMQVPGLCPRCGEPNTGQCGAPRQGRWTECEPPINRDCDCPVVGYTRFHLPGCKHF